MNRMALVGVIMLAAMSLQAQDDLAKPLSGLVASIDGKPVSLGSYSGKVVLVVNVASRCGFTSQYKQLQELYARYESFGFVVLAFPCNQFASQEPGDEMQIKAYCEKKFGVSFPMFKKIDVNGEKATRLYKYLTSDRTPIADQGPVKWNFEKFLFNRNGELIARYRSAVVPTATNVVATIERALRSGFY